MMRKSTDHNHAAADPDDEADNSDWLAQYPSGGDLRGGAATGGDVRRAVEQAEEDGGQR